MEFLLIAPFCFSFFLSRFYLGKFDFRWGSAGLEAREKGHIHAGVGYLWLARSSRWAARALFKSLLVVEVENKLSVCELFLFLHKKWDHFRGGGCPPQ
jgi:hypothetical protein